MELSRSVKHFDPFLIDDNVAEGVTVFALSNQFIMTIKG